tara:strand:- start:47 stop:544 length:498 start_codon:yes stop_codon:yes gene_type:complete
MKRCIKCNIEKTLTEFNKNKTNKDGLQYMCNKCWKEYRKKRSGITKTYQKNRRILKKKLVEEEDRLKQTKEGYGVYTLTHLPTQTYYVGEGWIHNRRHTHFSKLESNTSTSTNLQLYFNQYPNVDDWEFKVIKKWDFYNKEEGKGLETDLIIEGRNNNSVLNMRL